MINFYKINNEKFKSIYFSVNFTMNANEKEISENALLAAVLSKSTKEYKTQKEIEKYLYSLYGAPFDVEVEKFGDLYNIEFAVECVNKKFLPNEQDVVKDVVKFLYSVIYEPNVIDDQFDLNLIEREKENILDKIRSKKDDKLKYGVLKTEELMTSPDNFSVFLYGSEKYVKNTSSKDLYNRYIGMLNDSCITIGVSGNLSGYDDIEEIVKSIFKNANSNLSYSDLKYDESSNIESNAIKEIEENSDTAQSVITFGLELKDVSAEDFFVLNVYNAILGATPSSKLFQNFREKESLAYTVRSRYYRFKSIIIIYAGIEKKNYEKAKEVIYKELDDMLKGNITEEEFNASKNSIIADLMEWKDSKIALAKMLLSNLIVYKNNNMSIEDMIDKLKEVTLSDVVNIAKKVEVKKIFLLGGLENE